MMLYSFIPIMSQDSVTLAKPPPKLDYNLTGVNSRLAVERGLAEADWYQCAVPREKMRQLLVRRDGPALRDTILWFALIFGSAYAAFSLWHLVGNYSLRHLWSALCLNV